MNGDNKGINNTMKPLKINYHRDRYGVYGQIYHEWTINQKIKYNIKHSTYRELYNLPKNNIGKSAKYII